MRTAVRFATIVDAGYLARGVVMLESLRAVLPGVPVDVLCMDAAARAGVQCLGLDGVRAIGIDELEAFDPELPLVRGERTLAEYCWTAKPSFCRFLFERHADAEEIVYADADLMFFHDPGPVLAELADGAALVVPHRAPPGEDWERTRGTYNAGFVAFRRSPDASALLAWWRERCLEWCFDRVEPGRFCDQMYLDEWPRRFSGVRALAHIGGGVAPWNASMHRLESRRGSVWVDDVVPLVFFHFQSLSLYRGLVAKLVRLGVVSKRLRPVPGHASLAWSVWASYPVSKDAEQYVYLPYVRALAAAVARLADGGHFADTSYRRLGALDLARELARGIVPGPIRHALRPARGRAEVRGRALPTRHDEPPVPGS